MLGARGSQSSKQAEKLFARLLLLGGVRESFPSWLPAQGKLMRRPGGEAVVFGPRDPRTGQPPPGQIQLVFRMGGSNRFAVGFRGELGHDELKAQLSRANRQLWDKEKDEPSAEYRAITDAAQALAQIGDLPTDKPVEPRSMLRMYDALRNLLACCKNGKKLSTAWTVYEQLRQEASEQAPAFFDAVTESPKVRNLKNAALRLALELERPPTKRELRDRSGWTQDQQKEFNAVLQHAGLAWLSRHWKKPQISGSSSNLKP